MKSMRWKAFFYVLVTTLGTVPVAAQFAPAAGTPGSTAIFKDDAGFKEWATGCTVQRGYMNIANTQLGFASVGADSSAVGPAGTGTIVSLGDGGSATLTFDEAIGNGPDFDFAVFENGFYTTGDSIAFLELAFVEVSSDGVNFTRFPATSNIPTNKQLAMEGVNCRLVNNLAGKYVANYGTPFDLDELKDSAGLDVNHITHVRVVDVVGDIDPQYATRDKNGNIINDPWPTAFASCGFDLDAVGVLNVASPNAIKDITSNGLELYPNPLKMGGIAHIRLDAGAALIKVSDLNGKLCYSAFSTGERTALPTGGLNEGMYFVSVETTIGRYTNKLLVQ